MPSESTLSTHPLMAYALLAAIPMVLFALWADYFIRSFDAKKNGLPGELKRDEELQKIRASVLFFFVFQAAIFLFSWPLRKEHPLSSIGIFVVALMLHSQIQFAAERKTRDLAATSSQKLAMDLRALRWTLFGIGLYLGVITLTVIGFKLAGDALGVSREGSAVLLLAGGALGIMLGLAITFAMAPIHLKKILPVTLLDDPENIAMIDRCFKQAKLTTPRIWVVNLDDFKFNNALVAGLRQGTGWFKPGLFITKSLLATLTEPELRAVILHEVSHLALNHLGRRLVFSLFSVIASISGSGAVIALGYASGLPMVSLLASVSGFVIAFLVPFHFIRKQARKHESEADFHAIHDLEAGFDFFASALRKIDQLNDLSDSPDEPGSVILPGSGHPSTERRLIQLREMLSAAAPARSDQDESRNKAA